MDYMKCDNCLVNLAYALSGEVFGYLHLSCKNIFNNCFITMIFFHLESGAEAVAS